MPKDGDMVESYCPIADRIVPKVWESHWYGGFFKCTVCGGRGKCGR